MLWGTDRQVDQTTADLTGGASAVVMLVRRAMVFMLLEVTARRVTLDFVPHVGRQEQTEV
jgi:hypothetical protein